MSIEPGADELRMRALLKQRIDPKPADWWEPKPEPAEPDDEPELETAGRPPVFAPAPAYWPRPHVPAVLVHAPERAAAAISPRTRRLLYNASAAGAGWGLGLYQRFAWALNDCGTSQGVPAALVLGIGGALVIAHVWDRRTRHWWPGIAWVARIPLATALLALALYAPAAP
ncbi:hypothetical protein AB0M11_26500 [Streptomyces sp. NPDC051987]|uniref:hypothetical protein n=1 Tax=Streptomyces sp. NPDC051987 TaxID=3155808 RepID=UPI003415C475